MPRRAATVVLVALLLVAGTGSASAESRAAPVPFPPPQGPTLETDAALLAAALSCPSSFTSADHEPLLLVHGTYATADENWGWNYLADLPPQGFDVCTVTLPGRAVGDIQVSAEYVVYAVRQIAQRSGRLVDVVGHSQGGLEPRWAIKWWPDVPVLVDDLVMLGTPNHGTVVANAGGAFGCHDSCHQMTQGSAFLGALNGGDETPGDVSYTSIYSLTDELVQPQAPESTSAVAGGANFLVQGRCPGRVVDHVFLPADAVVHALVVDALTRLGPADPDAVGLATCARVTYPGFDATRFRDQFNRPHPGFPPQLGGGREEPPLKPYAQPGG